MAAIRNTNSSAKRSKNAPNNMRDVTPDLRIPDIRELFAHLHFNPTEGRIWLEDCRMILVHAEAFGGLRQELIDTLGIEMTRGLLTRMGYLAGSRDAGLALKIRGPGSQLDVLTTGAQLHALEGMVKVTPIKVEMDSTLGYCYGEFAWEHSMEGDLHVAGHGIGSEPACWMEIGYSSGFMSTLMGKRILVREVECQSMGHNECRAIGKPMEQWENPEEDLKYLQPQPLNRPAPVPEKNFAFVMPSLMPRSQRLDNGQRLVGASAGFTSTMHKILRVAPTNATVLLLGESGVGKSMFAREVHLNSRRHDQDFIQINCAAIPDQLIESELFGVERGAFSGATESRAGRFEIATKGTLFLDEIGTLSPTAQGKLLRVLQSGELERLGSTKTIKVDVRVVAATNENLEEAVKEGRFRSDLYYRLNVFPVTIPPLRDRTDDLPVLLEFYLSKFASHHGRVPSGITPRALQAILNHPWPGNIREFENVIERGIILAEDGEPLDIRHLFGTDTKNNTRAVPSANSPAGGLVSGIHLLDGNHFSTAEISFNDIDAWARRVVDEGETTLETVEQALVRAALGIAEGNISKAATLLGITRAQMDYKAKKLE